MKLKSIISVFLSLAIITQGAPLNFSKRRFGNESSEKAIAVFQDVKSITEGTDKEAVGADLSVKAIKALFVDASACDQQDRADDIIDLGHSLGGEKENKLIEVAKSYRQLERNSPDGQPSELCIKPPKNAELNGLFQAQEYDTQSITPNEPDPDDPDQEATATPYTVTPNEPDPEYPDLIATVLPNTVTPTPNTVTPNEDPDQKATVAPTSKDDPDQKDTVTPNTVTPTVTPKEHEPGSGDGKVLPKDSDEDSEHDDDGSSIKSNIPQGFA